MSEIRSARDAVVIVLPNPTNTGAGPAARKSVSVAGGVQSMTGAGHQ